ncbi:MAG: hypothetical protein RLZ12_772 [Bacillota bacterium]|jgi:hypothetical protein
MVNFDNPLQFFSAERYSAHTGLNFSSARYAKKHFQSQLKDGKYTIKQEERNKPYELAADLIKDPARLSFFKQMLLNNALTTDSYPADATYIKSCRANSTAWSVLQNTVEFALSYHDPTIRPGSLFEYPVTHAPYWWQTAPLTQPIELTVALPILNNQELIWFPLTSLSKQTEVDFGWELISYEEEGLSRATIQEFANELPGCRRIIHRTIKPGDGLFPPSYTLLEKWVNMARIASASSRILVAQASDDYSPRYRLKGHYVNFQQAGCNFSKRSKGYFFDLNSHKYACFDISKHQDPQVRLRQGLDIACNLESVRSLQLPPWPCFRYIDNFFSRKTPLTEESVSYYDQIFPEAALDGLVTDGYNSISHTRQEVYQNKRSYRHLYALSTPPKLSIAKEVLDKLKQLQPKQPPQKLREPFWMRWLKWLYFKVKSSRP